jgi:hypothetical protein
VACSEKIPLGNNWCDGIDDRSLDLEFDLKKWLIE